MEKGHIKIRMQVEGIRNPKTNALLAKDRDYIVPENQFFLRRLEQGDCVKVEKEMEKPKAKRKTKPRTVASPPKKVEEPVIEQPEKMEE